MIYKVSVTSWKNIFYKSDDKPESNMCGCVDMKDSGLAKRLFLIHNNA